jgi:hypothetical protein
MLPILLTVLSCGPKKPVSEIPFEWPIELPLLYVAEFQQTGIYRTTGSVDLNQSINLIFDISCIASPQDGRTQKMKCTLPTDILVLQQASEDEQQFSGEVNLIWKGPKLHRIDVEGLSDSMTSVFDAVFGSLEFGPIPDNCSKNTNWTDKSALAVAKIHGLTGPASYRNEYRIEDCENNMRIKIDSTIALSAMVTDNSSAPTFTFEGSDYVVFDSTSKIMLSRQHTQILSGTSTALIPGSVRQSVSIRKK